jgi:hypothetical protein
MGGYSWEDDSGSSSSGGMSGGGEDFRSARKAYKDTSPKPDSRRSTARSSGRSSRASHDFSSARGKTGAPITRKKLAVSTKSTHPLVVCCDHTGSFSEEVKIILEKLPLLGTEAKRYMPQGEICFTLIGDTTSDSFPLQVRDFKKGKPLDTELKKLWPECDGGDSPESYDLAAYYFTHHCEMPNAVKPLFVWILDSNTRAKLRADDVREYIGDDVQSDLNSKDVLRKLADKFEVYVLLEGGSCRSFWAGIYGADNVIPLDEPRDIIEMIIGIVAGEAGEYEDFELRSGKRHSDRPDRVSRVKKSLRSVSAKSSGGDKDGVAAKKKTGKKSLKSKKLT